MTVGFEGDRDRGLTPSAGALSQPFGLETTEIRRVLRTGPLANRTMRYRLRMGSAFHAPTPRSPGWFSTKFDSSKVHGSPSTGRTAARQWVLVRNLRRSSPSRIRALGPAGVRGVESRGGKSMEPLEHSSLDHQRTSHRSCSGPEWPRSASCSGFRRSAARRIAGTCATIAALATPSGR